jgi:alpha 1,3-glucosidase
MVAIVDPHIKRTDSFRVYKDSLDLDLLIKKADKNNFDGWCWPGSSVWVDFFNPASWEWWTRMFSFETWADQTKALFVWNDMNEPSVFDGPEITMPKDNIHAGGWEHRDVHNINGMLFHNQTQHAISVREPTKKRPFVLSRSYFAGSQRYGAIWTGDNLGTWEHMAGEAAMFLSNSIAGISFIGADIGGFFGNPSNEMLVRWYQAGAFMPFMRAHAHIDTKRREPYLFEEPIRSHLRDTLRLRYTLLPAWYNAFHDAATKGHPVIWPQYAKFPGDEGGAAVDNQYYVGDSGLLFRPVVAEGAVSADVYLAAPEPYYDYFSSRMWPARSKPRNVTVDTPLDKFPLLIEGGHIFPSRERVRRSSALMAQDPVTLTVALGKNQAAVGQLYLDDGETFAWESGAFVHRALEFKGGKLTSSQKVAHDAKNAYAQSIKNVGVERVRVLGLEKAPSSVTVGGKAVQFEWEKGAPKAKEARAHVLTIKNPGVKVIDDWEIVLA